jgi:hypothetical protein
MKTAVHSEMDRDIFVDSWKICTQASKLGLLVLRESKEKDTF